MTYKRTPNWKTKGIIIASKTKRKLYLQNRYTNSNAAKLKYKRYCKIMKSVTRKSKKIANTNYINKSTNKSKATWEIIKQNTTKFNHIKETIDYIKKDDILINQPSDIAETINNYFINLNNPLETKSDVQYKPITQG